MLYKIDKKDRICEPLAEEWTKEEDNAYMQVQPNTPQTLFSAIQTQQAPGMMGHDKDMNA